MSNDKAVGFDGMSIEAMKAGGTALQKQLAGLFISCVQSNKTPDH